MVNFESREKYDFYDLERLIKILRSPDGCPWDIEQTHESIRRNFIEEAYEAAEAIDNGDALHLREELGDVLTQVVFHSGIEEDAGRFTLNDVADATVRKLLYRHPHVFGDSAANAAGENGSAANDDLTVAETSAAVLVNWDELKRREKSQESLYDELNAVARSLPALWRTEKVLKKADKAIQRDEPIALSRVDELEELRALYNEMQVRLTQSEDALNAATERFILRFNEQ